MPTVCRRFWASSLMDRRVSSQPSTSFRPEVGRSRPPSRCRSVDLPEPDLPSSTSFSPRFTSRETPRRARTVVRPVFHSLTTSLTRTATTASPLPRVSASLPLSGNGRHRRRDLLGIAEVLAAQRLQLIVELVDQWQARGDVQLDDVLIRDVIQVLDESPQAVSMSCDQHALARADGRGDCLVPVRQEALDGVLEALGPRQLAVRQRGVAAIMTREALIAGFQGGRADVVTAPPDLHLGFAKLASRLRLVQPLKRSVMAFIEPPGADDGEPHQVHRVEHDPQGSDGSLQDGGEGEVEGEALLAAHLPSGSGLLPALLRQIHVGPAGEAVLAIPGALAVAQKDELMHAVISGPQA